MTTRTVSAICACGAPFTREVKRGRPQVWCPSCVLVPFYERSASAAEILSADLPGVEAAPERIVNENDRLDHVRVDIEAGMVLINADHKTRFHALVAGGMLPVEAGERAAVESLAASQNLYAELAPKFYTPGREVDDA